MRSAGLYWGLLQTYIRVQAGKVAILSLLVIGSTGLELVKPQIMRTFIDTAMSASVLGSLAAYGIAYIAVSLVAQAVLGMTRYLGDDIGWVATNRLRGDLTLHCLGLDMDFHKKRTSGELIERIDGDVNLLSNYLSRFAADIVRSVLLLVGALALLYRESMLVGLSMAGFAVFAVVLLIWLRAIATARFVKVRKASAEYFSFLGETLSSREDIRANGAVGYVMRRVHAILENWYRLNIHAGVAGYSMWMSNILVFALGTMLALGLGWYLWLYHNVTLGTVFIIYQYTEMMRGPVEAIRQQLQDLQRAGAGIERIQEIRAHKPAVVSGGRALVGTGALPVSISDVNFEYEAGDSVLKRISVEIPAGRVIGVLGRTGSGKTTLANLLGRLYDVSSGEILLGGEPIRSLDLTCLRQRVAVVTQNVQLFHGTVRDNVSLFDLSISDDSILGALDQAGLGTWFGSLPEGLSTNLQGGGGLSAGQAQLLAFARVLLRDPGLVILDEASSRLDPATEGLLGEAMRRLLAGRTGMIIAHRLSTVEMTDDIMILENGEIVEFGERLALMRDPSSKFYRLLQVGMEELLA